MDWKTITLFISSTFNDMHDERDFIKRHIVSRLNDTLEPYRISVQVTDLRWGIDTHNLLEEEREQKVLHICLDAIENSRPYFIGILGHRYGWIPDSRRLKVVRDQYSLPGEDPCSVTEMEIMLGAISKREYLDHSYFFFRDSSMENVLYAISAGYTAETKRCRQLEERAKAIRQGYFTKEELLSGNFKTLFSYFSTVLSRLDDEPSLFKEAHDLFLENKARYGSGLAQSGLVNSYFSCWEKYLLSLHERYRSIYREESGLATDGGSVDYDRIAKREHEVELLTSEELQCLLEECKWFRDCADPMTTVLLYRNLWGRKLRFLTGKGNLDTDINVRIAAYQQIQAQLWSLYPTILGSGDEWNIQRFNDAAGELVDTYRRLFHIFSNTPFQPTELSEYLDRLS